jgi:hypothetical protein
MSRFDIGTRVRVVGGVAEHYPDATAIVLAVRPDPQGLRHLNKYCVFTSDGREETFYEFQLAQIRHESLADTA